MDIKHFLSCYCNIECKYETFFSCDTIELEKNIPRYRSPVNWECNHELRINRHIEKCVIPRYDGSYLRSIIDLGKNRERRVASRLVASRRERRQIWILTLSYLLVSALPRASRIEYDAHLYNPSLHSFPFLLPRPVHSHARASARMSLISDDPFEGVSLSFSFPRSPPHRSSSPGRFSQSKKVPGPGTR